ncbi:MAG: glycosyltransferase family 9 protein [Nocardioidaceae bacterium]
MTVRGAGAPAGRVLAVRLDNVGDVLVTGPALRALAAGSRSVTLLAGPGGAAAARLLPGVADVLTWHCPWIDAQPRPVDRADVYALVDDLRHRSFDAAFVFTSFHQSPLPTALLLRLAGVPWIGAISVDYPGSLLDLRHRVDDDQPEPERALALVRAAGHDLASGDDGRLHLRADLPPAPVDRSRYVVVHPGTSVPARAYPPQRCAEAVAALHAHGWDVVVTGSPDERSLAAAVGGGCAVNLAGRTSLAQLGAVLAGAAAVVVGNTGPAHLAAAVGTPVVSLFAPTVPAARWAPYGVPSVLLGDQQAPCRDSRATRCPVPGHPCLTSVTSQQVVAAVERLAGPPVLAPTPTAATALEEVR